MEDKELKKEDLKEEEMPADANETAEGQGTEGQEEAPAESGEDEAGSSQEKKGFFGKKKRDAKDTQDEDLTDRLKRTMAEFDNFRKRTDKEKASMYEVGARDVIEKILPVVDNFERGLGTIPEEGKETPFAEGMEKIYKQLMKTLDDMDVKAIEAVGKEFDPNVHNAVMHVDDEALGENMVAEEFQKGYTYHGTVIRHSMVKVAN